MRHAQCLKSKKHIVMWRASEQPQAMAPHATGWWIISPVPLILLKKGSEILGQWEGRTIHLGHQPD